MFVCLLTCLKASIGRSGQRWELNKDRSDLHLILFIIKRPNNQVFLIRKSYLMVAKVSVRQSILLY